MTRFGGGSHGLQVTSANQQRHPRAPLKPQGVNPVRMAPALGMCACVVRGAHPLWGLPSSTPPH
eukprot:scaffold6723_cov121-Isochrysis_galbana.AAC.3